MCSAEPLTCAMSALGRDRVMFAADYPFESSEEAAHFIDSVPLTRRRETISASIRPQNISCCRPTDNNNTRSGESGGTMVAVNRHRRSTTSWPAPSG